MQDRKEFVQIASMIALTGLVQHSANVAGAVAAKATYASAARELAEALADAFDVPPSREVAPDEIDEDPPVELDQGAEPATDATEPPVV